MSNRELHHKPDHCDSRCPQNCNCRYSSWPIWMLYVLFAIFVICSPVIVIIAINIWYVNEDRLQPALVDAIYYCAEQGSLHPSLRPIQPLGTGSHARPLHNAAPPYRPSGESDDWLERDSREHPEGLCKEIKKIIHQSIDYCEDCKKKKPEEQPFEPPLVLGGFGSEEDGDGEDTVEIEITDGETAGDEEDANKDDVAVEITDGESADDNNKGVCAGDLITNITIKRNQELDKMFTKDELDLPQFCPDSNEFKLGPNNNRRLLKENGAPKAGSMPTREWELLERPRVHHARTVRKPDNWPNTSANKDDLVGGPYVVFIAKHLDGMCCEKKKDGKSEQIAVRDKERITVFILYLDWVTEQPTIIEFDVEIERGKDIVSVEDTVQLISNVRLDSLDRQITFQIGRGARRIVIAGYDFSGESTATDVGRRRRSEEDTSGSYRISLTADGAIEQVYRLP